MKDEREIAQLHRKNWDQLGGSPKGGHGAQDIFLSMSMGKGSHPAREVQFF